MSIQDLKELIIGDVSNSSDDIQHYSCDASIFEVKPEVVVAPKDVDDVKKLVKWVSENKSQDPLLSITARAAGSDMSGGPLNDSIILDFTKYFNHVLEVGETDRQALSDRACLSVGYAITEPGVYYRDFEKETLANGLLMPAYPASREICTVGGMVANNSGGEKSLSYGKTEKYVEELNVVLSDGNEYVLKALGEEELEAKKSQHDFEGQIYRQMHALIENNYDAIQTAKPNVSKNSAGYYLWNVWDKKIFDLTKLFTGSQGTLGLITKIKFKLIKPKKYSKLLVIFLNNLATLGDLVNKVMKFKPESFECYDDQTLKLAVRFLPDIVKKMHGNLISELLKFLPEAGMILTGGIPELVLIAEFTGDEEAQVDEVLKSAEESVKKEFPVKTHIVTTAQEAEKYWTIRRESFNLLRKHVAGKHTAPFIDDIIVHVDQLPTFLPKLNELISQYKGLTYTIAGHAGDANFHVIPLMDFSIEDNRKAIPELSDKVYDLVISLHGSITAEHNDGLIRTPYLEKMYGPEITALFAKTKEIFDPLNIFNPRKKVNGNMDYSMSHITQQ